MGRARDIYTLDQSGCLSGSAFAIKEQSQRCSSYCPGRARYTSDILQIANLHFYVDNNIGVLSIMEIYGLDTTQCGHQWVQCCHRSVLGIYLFARRANVQQCGGECTCTTHVSSTNENILNSSINTMVRVQIKNNLMCLMTSLKMC